MRFQNGIKSAAAFLRSERGATAIEYGMIAAFIALIIVTAIGLTGTKLLGAYEKVNNLF